MLKHYINKKFIHSEKNKEEKILLFYVGKQWTKRRNLASVIN